MVRIKGKYSFSTFADWLTGEGTTLSQTFSAGIEIPDSTDGNEYRLIPMNSRFEKLTIHVDGFPFIEYRLVDPTFSHKNSFTVIEIGPSFFVIVSTIASQPLRELQVDLVVDKISEFLYSEFEGATSYFVPHVSEICDEFGTFKLNSNQVKAYSEDELMRLIPSAVPLIPKSESLVPDEILTAGPSISSLERSYVADATAKGWNSRHSDYLNAFQVEFAELVGSKFALATSSCTGALHLSLLALGIGPGDEVIIPEITWVATASAVMYVGAKPVFVDVDPNHWTVDLSKIREAITGKTRAIIPVHLYGYAAAMEEIMQIANEFDLAVIEDAAPAIGTRIGSKYAGTFGNFGCFSFQGAKLLVTGEGGMLVTDNSELFEKARKIQDHGRRPGTFWIEELGYKYKMNNITAALGLAQVQRANNQIERKRQLNTWYREGLVDLKHINFQEEAENTKSICWMTSFSLNPTSGLSREELMGQLKQKGIDTRPVFPAISQYPIWRYKPETQPIAKFIGDTSINLPSGVGLNKKSIDYITETIRSLL